MPHTPGPWAAAIDEEVGGCREIIAHVAAADGPQALAYTTGLWDDDEDLANARLIAAAPDLLLALQALVETTQTWRADETCDHAAGICWCGVDSELVDARDAIARTSGPAGPIGQRGAARG